MELQFNKKTQSRNYENIEQEEASHFLHKRNKTKLKRNYEI